jgi:hypothetical protein
VGHAPAQAADPVTAEAVIDQYFKARDQEWFGGGPGTRRAIPGVSYSAQAQGEIDKLARIAAEVRAESGLAAEDVVTSTASTETEATCTHWIVKASKRWCIGGAQTLQADVGTTLKWNLGGSGDSFIGDGYTASLTWKMATVSSPREYTIERMALTPVPRDDAEPETAPTVAEMGLEAASTDRAQAVAIHEQRKARGESAPQLEDERATAGTYSFDANAAAAYALRWADGYNPAYKKQDNDCTNFVSQALLAGNWRLLGGVDPSDRGNWHYDLSGPATNSKTWSVSGWLLHFATSTTSRAIALPRGEAANSWAGLWDLRKGDLIFNDWGTGGADGIIDHAMIVDGYFVFDGFIEPTISQHSNARRNLPLSVIIKIAANSYGSIMRFYPAHPKSSYTE